MCSTRSGVRCRQADARRNTSRTPRGCRCAARSYRECGDRFGSADSRRTHSAPGPRVVPSREPTPSLPMTAARWRRRIRLWSDRTESTPWRGALWPGIRVGRRHYCLAEARVSASSRSECRARRIWRARRCTAGRRECVPGDRPQRPPGSPPSSHRPPESWRPRRSGIGPGRVVRIGRCRHATPDSTSIREPTPQLVSALPPRPSERRPPPGIPTVCSSPSPVLCVRKVMTLKAAPIRRSTPKLGSPTPARTGRARSAEDDPGRFGATVETDVGISS